jgi:hypothetical protein
MSDALIF